MSHERLAPSTHHASVRSLFDAQEVRDVMADSFYRPEPAQPTPARKRTKPTEKPTHYEVICISMYTDDLAMLDEKVAELKKRGHRKMSRSALIRYALAKLDVRKVPPPL